jgi:hypothetical protein
LGAGGIFLQDLFEKFQKKDHQFRKKCYLAVKMIFDFIL